MDQSYAAVEAQIEKAIGALSQGLYTLVAAAARGFESQRCNFTTVNPSEEKALHKSDAPRAKIPRRDR